ncbi:hypothetical protein GGI07_000892 [Coemansia sp. Benny D115]|nr:hypothetical protein GGI07_000892 [Coemansia sp. Benny D115]
MSIEDVPPSATTTANGAVNGNVKRVCVFCGSKDSTYPEVNEAANKLGTEIVKAGYGLVYGGGNHGLMGRVAQSAFDNGGDILGIVPKALVGIENSTFIGNTVVVNTMHERKSKMNDNAAAFIALPGGYGTFEELLEITVWSILSIHVKPVIVLNINGYYNPLKDLINNAVDFNFVAKGNQNAIVFCDTPEEAVAAIADYVLPESRYQLDWTAPKAENA